MSQTKQTAEDCNRASSHEDPEARAIPEPSGGAPIRSEELFAGRQKVAILHAGGLYQLRQTRHGKLILTK